MKKGLSETWAKKPSRAADVGPIPSPLGLLGLTICLMSGGMVLLASLAIDSAYLTASCPALEDEPDSIEIFKMLDTS